MTRSVRDQLTRAVERLAGAGVESPLLNAQLIMARVLTASRLDIMTHPDRRITPHQISQFSGMVERRALREPLEYILGTREFYGLEFHINPHAFIPCAETELLVETVLDRVGRGEVRIADIGTGSGVIAVTLAVNSPAARVLAVDISEMALEVARANAKKHSVTDRVEFVLGDLLAPLKRESEAYNAIVSNPPYVPSGEIAALQPEVADWLPRTALDGGDDGLHPYRLLVADASDFLEEDGILALEVGDGQAQAVREIALRAGFTRVDTVRDLAGIERVVVASK